ncbi:MAG: KilA-N domain-containing protein [Pseudoalteromonas prydzensis]|uniref:KilA-N domain-containing protein n=1 Tax=Pseudoalteromonas prydzensis TaxID=182141 RepID=UPI003F9673DC
MAAKLTVLEKDISTFKQGDIEYINITDIARYKNTARTDDLIRNWLRNCNTIEFLDIWEQLNNPHFNPVEFDGFKKEAGLNSFTLTAKQWRIANPKIKGNMRDHANVHQLVCLANLESLNAHFIEQKVNQAQRLESLNQLAIKQIRILSNSAAQQSTITMATTLKDVK